MAITEILREFGISCPPEAIRSFGSGLINHTWVAANSTGKYILQRINGQVFKSPEAIASNIDHIGAYLNQVHPGYPFTRPVNTLSGSGLLRLEGDGYYRLFDFVSDSHSVDVVETPEQAFEAAVQFGRFTRSLSGFDVNQLSITIPDFHNLSLRYSQFLDALKNGNPERIQEALSLADTLQANADIVTRFERIKINPSFKLRVTHHDTKISNVLFDQHNHGLCVIDLDTVMPGYFISDLGDMMRTYLSPVSEEEKDFSRICIREDFYRAVVRGYHSEMKDVLTEEEKSHYFYAGTFIIYMQAIRFLTDHLNNDCYYGAKYPGHNFVRAGNQVTLLQRLLEKKELLESYH